MVVEVVVEGEMAMEAMVAAHAAVGSVTEAAVSKEMAVAAAAKEAEVRVVAMVMVVVVAPAAATLEAARAADKKNGPP